MDPDACYERLLDALREGDMEEASYAAYDIAFWIDRGGNPPVRLGGWSGAFRSLRSAQAALAWMDGLLEEDDRLTEENNKK